MKTSKYIDHTLLKADATKQQITQLCNEALEYDFASVCVNPTWVSYCFKLLKESNVKVCTVIGFPLGASTSEIKELETKDAIKNGASEIDMVINIGALKSELDNIVLDEIKKVVNAASPLLVKVIIETALLSEKQKVRACELALEANAAFVKTSTGFSTGGATVEDVALMKSIVGLKMEVKASGGIKTKEDFNAMVDAGASRIGTSNGIKLL